MAAFGAEGCRSQMAVLLWKLPMELKIELPESAAEQLTQETDIRSYIATAVQEKLKRDKNEEQYAFLKIITLSQGFILSNAILVMAKLKIDTLLEAGPKSADILAREAGCESDILYRFLRALSSVGVFRHRGDEKFELTSISRHFFILSSCFFDERAYRAWNHSLNTLLTGEPGWSKEYGKSFFDYLNASPIDTDEFSAWNTRSANDWLAPIVSLVDFGQFRKIVDVGGGEGSFVSQILKANPNLTATLFDLPQVVSGAGAQLESMGVASRCNAIGGNFFDFVPEGGDAYLLARVLLNWDEQHSKKILCACHNAMQGQGTLLVVDFMIPPKDHLAYQTLVFNDLNLLMTFNGANRTEQDWRSLLDRASFRVTRILSAPEPSLLSLIEAVPF